MNTFASNDLTSGGMSRGSSLAEPAPTLSEAAANRPKKIRILVAEDHGVLRQVLAEFLQTESDMEVVAEASDGLEAVALAIETRPDVVLMDYAMPRLDGVEGTRQIMAMLPQARIIGFSMYEDHIGQKMQRAGVAAYVTKGDAPDELVRVIRDVLCRSAASSPRSPSG